MEATVENNVNNGQPSPAQNVRSQPKIPESIKRNQKNNKKDKGPLLTKNDKGKIVRGTKGFLIGALKFVIIVGICYVILSPLITIVARSFFSDEDKYSPVVYLIPIHPTIEKYQIAIKTMGYWSVLIKSVILDLSLMLIQVLVCSMVGYGFARFEFKFKKLLFGCVIAMIVIPTHTIMLPLYMTFRNFFGANLHSTVVPIYLLTVFGVGLRSGLYIYIFVQFFRGLPKEIEEAAFVDGAGMWYTYFFIMLRNAVPSIITVAIFSVVWQYNDTFYANLFNVSDKIVISKNIVSLGSQVSNVYRIMDSEIVQLYTNAGVVLTLTPLLIFYIALQKQFVEGVERSGIVG